VPGTGADTRPDLVDRAFTATGPDQLWVADITYCRTFSGWVYAAFVIDVYSRRVVGWQLSTYLRTELALDAREMGIWTRRRTGRDLGGLLHHSDKGVHYVAVRDTQRLGEVGVDTRRGWKQAADDGRARCKGRQRRAAAPELGQCATGRDPDAWSPRRVPHRCLSRPGPPRRRRVSRRERRAASRRLGRSGRARGLRRP
jgi:hypothetical protein